LGVHRPTSQGLGEPPDSGKAIIFRAKAKVFGQKPAAKNEKKLFFWYFLNEKTEFILSKVPEIRDFY